MNDNLNRLTFAEMKQSVTVRQVLVHFFPHHLNWQHSPFHRDKKPSFSIYDGDRRCRDHALGVDFDALNLVGYCLGFGEHQQFYTPRQWALIAQWFTDRTGALGICPVLTPKSSFKNPFWMDALTWPTDEQLSKIAITRKLFLAGLDQARERRHLFVGSTDKIDFWAYTDRSESLLMRRLDGQMWALANGQQTKNWTPAGYRQKPIGIVEAHRYLTLWLVEGAPDALAAYCWALLKFQPLSEIGIICAPSGVTRLDKEPDLWRGLEDYPVTIFAHGDSAGQTSALRWKRQLQGLGLKQIAITECQGDLNDMVSAALPEANE
jgi:hypothetical protein